MANIIVNEDYIEHLKYKIENLSIQNYQLTKKLEQIADARDHAEFRIRTELEPRIKQEQRRYDFWVTQQTGEEQCDYFCSTIDKLCDYIDEQNERFFEWEENDGDLYQMILYLIKNRTDIDIYKIEEKD